MAVFSSSIDTLQQLFVEQLRDLYDGEQQIVKALPKLIVKAGDSALREALRDHLKETQVQIARLEKIFSELGEKPSGVTCKGMEGILHEADHLLARCKSPSVTDPCIIASAQRVEHYEIAGYGTAKAFARRLGQTNLAQILGETLSEEKEEDRKLTQIAETLDRQTRQAA
jgi:ferritin-like metal-binding protein YciE